MWTEKTLDLGSGRTLHAHQAGAGPEVVLLHGALTAAHDWLESPVAGDLARDRRVTILDRPGHGLSRRPRFSGSPREQAAQIAEGLERLGIERPIVAAHSFGGLVTLALAERLGEHMPAMVLVAPIAFPEPRLLEHSLLAPRSVPFLGPFLSQVAETMQVDRAMIAIAQRLMFSPAEVPAQWAQTFPYDLVLDAEALVFEGEDAASILPLSPAGSFPVAVLETPAHVFTGSADKIVEDERQAKALARLLPNGRLTEIEGGGHMLHHTHSAPIIAAIREAAAPTRA